MTLIKVILSPTLLNFYSKNEDGDALLADYTLFSNVSLDRQYGVAILKTIRFSLVYPSSGTYEAVKKVFHPYQVHLRWLDDTDPGYHPGLIVQNRIYDQSTGLILNESNQSTLKPAYSTFCQFEVVSAIIEPDSPAVEPDSPAVYNYGDMEWFNYNLIREALIKEGSFTSLSFELYFTNLRGQRIYRNIPNVEIEFDLN